MVVLVQSPRMLRFVVGPISGLAVSAPSRKSSVQNHGPPQSTVSTTSVCTGSSGNLDVELCKQQSERRTGDFTIYFTWIGEVITTKITKSNK